MTGVVEASKAEEAAAAADEASNVALFIIAAAMDSLLPPPPPLPLLLLFRSVPIPAAELFVIGDEGICNRKQSMSGELKN